MCVNPNGSTRAEAQLVVSLTCRWRWGSVLFPELPHLAATCTWERQPQGDGVGLERAQVRNHVVSLAGPPVLDGTSRIPDRSRASAADLSSFDRTSNGPSGPVEDQFVVTTGSRRGPRARPWPAPCDRGQGRWRTV